MSLMTTCECGQKYGTFEPPPNHAPPDHDGRCLQDHERWPCRYTVAYHREHHPAALQQIEGEE